MNEYINKKNNAFNEYLGVDSNSDNLNLEKVFIHETANLAENTEVSEGTKIWMNVQVRENVKIGKNCVIAKDVYIDLNVKIGDGCKLQNGVYIYSGVEIDQDVFIGPNATFTNDILPRAFINNWEVIKTKIRKGASIGANATIICGITLGEYCMVGAGSVVTKDVPPFSLVVGNPAKLIAIIDKEGRRVKNI